MTPFVYYVIGIYKRESQGVIFLVHATVGVFTTKSIEFIINTELGKHMTTEVDRKIAVILVADVVGYSKHMERDENATLKACAECEKILKNCLKKYKGSIFNTAGDSALVEFPSAVNAAEYGVAFQNDIKKRNEADKTE